jgi:hypothetical protein
MTTKRKNRGLHMKPRPAPIKKTVKGHATIEEAYDEASPTGKRFIESQAERKNEVIDRTRSRMGGSSIRVRHPHERGRMKNGKWVWEKV